MTPLFQRTFLSLFTLAATWLAFASTTFAQEAAARTETATNVPPSGFVALFNGKDLAGWIGRGHVDPMVLMKMSPAERAAEIAKGLEDVAKHWSIDNGELVNDGHGLYLTTAKDYGDFELLLDYKTVAKADSGIYLRGTPQVQIWDTTKEGGKWDRGADKGSGGLFNNQKTSRDALVHADKPFGEWNHFRILMIGENVSVWLNEKLVVDDLPLENFYDRKQPVYAVGPIQLQTHGGEIRFRNVFLREIPRKPPESGTLAKGEPVGDDWEKVATPLAVQDAQPPSEKSYDDFEAHAMVQATGSQIGTLDFRSSEADQYSLGLGKEYWGQLRRGSGAAGPVWSAEPAIVAKAVKPNEMNHVYLRAKGPHIQVWMNGMPLLDLLDPNGPKNGTIAVSTRAATTVSNDGTAKPAVREGTLGAGTLVVRDLKNVPDPATYPAGPKSEEGFVSVFNGKDLTGWVGATDGHKVEGGKIVAPPKGGGNLYIDKKYANFVFRFDFRVYEGGNNGVGIRAEQGKDAAYYGMELQILDNTSPGYANLKPYQYHGSVYGVFPAKRGYQAPLGEWNTEEIIADGNRITVTLNGKVITDCDIAKEGRDAEGKQKTVDGGNHPGLFNKDGYIGFLGHGHRIELRNLRIKELP